MEERKNTEYVSPKDAPKTLVEYVWRVSQQVIVSSSPKWVQIVRFGSGFYGQYKNNLYFITADHVLHGDDWQEGIRTNENEYIFVDNHSLEKENGEFRSVYTPIGNMCYYDKYDFSSLFTDNNVDPEVVAIPDMQDVTFSNVTNFTFERPLFTEVLKNFNGDILVDAKLQKLIINLEQTCLPKGEDRYLVAGAIHNEIKREMVHCHENVLYGNLMFSRNEKEGIFLSAPNFQVCKKHWEGLSGSPVINQEGKLLGMLVREHEDSQELEILPITKIIEFIEMQERVERADAVYKKIK
ncbi:MAG: hypothetical protein MJZ20_08850 [Bacteroidaceae bacterium]|nr:hypothetical protein [Bacteroidaceae bacterium]